MYCLEVVYRQNGKDLHQLIMIEEKEEIMDRLGQVKILSMKIVPRCPGCREEQPNQLAHMDFPYGCLCDLSDSEEI